MLPSYDEAFSAALSCLLLVLLCKYATKYQGHEPTPYLGWLVGGMFAAMMLGFSIQAMMR